MISTKRKIHLLRIFDCSNSSERPTNRNFGGPVQNEFVSLLHKHSENFGCEFVNDIGISDIVFTNDVYPNFVFEYNKPKIKRMDGVFWQSEFKDRNLKYNIAAKQSDHVIFISEYSKNSYYKLYGDKLNSESVVLHWVEKKFDYNNCNEFNGKFFSMATNWNRKEKRLNEVIKFAEMFPECDIKLFGTCEEIVPSNVKCFGYIDSNSETFVENIKDCCGFLNLTCKDAATKTVCTSINYRIPVLYSRSGGVSELVSTYGVSINEIDEIEFLEVAPELNENDIKIGYENFKLRYEELKTNILEINPEQKLMNSLGKYFEMMKQFA